MKQKLLDLVASLTESLEIESDEQLDDIRSALQKEAGQNPGALQIPSLVLFGLNIDIAGEDLIEKSKSTTKNILPLVARREVSVDLPIRTGIPVFRGKAMRTERTIGPFTGPGGIEYWYDFFYRPLSKYEVWVEGGSRPLLILTSARLPRSRRGSAGYKITLSEGTVWVLASLLDGDVPDDGAYIGFSTSEGSLSFEEAPRLEDGDKKLVISHSIHARLKLKLQQPKAPEESVCNATSDVLTPGSIEIEWHHGNTPVIKIGSGEATLYSQKFQFEKYLQNVNYINSLEVIIFEYTVKPEKWDGSTVSSSLLNLSETVDIDRAGWAFPIITVGNADDLGEANGGFWLLECSEGLKADWLGTQGGLAELDKTYLALDDERFILTCTQTHAAKPGISQQVKLWSLAGDDTDRRLRFGMRYEDNFPLVYVCYSQQGELLYVVGNSEVQLDRPLGIDGQPITFDGGMGWVQLQVKDKVISFYGVALRDGLSFSGTPSLITEPMSLALRNALLTTTAPAMVTVRGDLVAEDRMDSGKLTTVYGIYSWQPILPDPYVANFACRENPDKGPTGALGEITGVAMAVVQWDVPTNPQMNFEGLLGLPYGIQPKPPTSIDPVGITHPECPVCMSSTQTSQGRLSMTEEETQQLLKEKQNALSGLRHAAAKRLAKNSQRINDLKGVFAEAAPFFNSGVMLLDVSTNQDLIGVKLGLGRMAGNDNFASVSTSIFSGMRTFFRLKGMDVIMPTAGVQVFALPQIQWEPVRTLPVDQDLVSLGYFPTPLASATDGGATVVAMPSQTLVPMIPEVVLKSLVKDFESGTPAAMMTTLPFGLKAAVTLSTRSRGSRSPDSLEITRPEFIDQGVRGGVQLTMKAESGAQHPNAQSAYFDGATVQLLNGVDIKTGAALGVSVLGGTNQPETTVESYFNKEFEPGSQFARVPVTRFDISGYGGSNFSDWENPLGQFAQATKVKFNVIVGRTAMEMVKIATVLYPWGIKLTRSVTIERRGGGGVIRRDSGWEPTSPGIFDFRYTDKDSPGVEHDSPYPFHPGLLRGLFNITNVRPAMGRIIKFTSSRGYEVELAPQYFDAKVKIEGLEADGEETVFATGILGFLQIKPVGEPLSSRDLQRLIELQSAIGGPIDCTVNVANAGLRMRALRIEVDVAENERSSEPSFVGVVRGMPQFRQSGAWSVIRQAGPGNPLAAQEASTVDDVRGLPVIRYQELDKPSGDKMAFTGATGPYRFADARDLFQADNPEFDYGFLQTSPAHALLFKRLYLYIDEGTSELRSNLGPLFADVFARFTSKSLFPPKENAIELALNPLVINPASGRFRLKNLVNMDVPRSPLILSNSGADSMRLEYDKASLSVGVLEASWSVELQGLEIWADVFGMEKFSGTTYRVIASNSQRPQLRDIETHLHEDFEDALAFIPGFADRGDFEPIDLNATNLKAELKLIVAIKPKLKDIGKVKTKVLFKTYIGITRGGGSLSGFAGFGFGAEIQVRIDAPPIPGVTFFIIGLSVAAGAKFKFKGDVSSGFELSAYVGYGVGKRIGPFKAEAYAAAGVVLDYRVSDAYGQVVKFGGLVLIRAEVDLEIVVIQIGAEFQALFYDDPRPLPPEGEGCGGTAVDYSGKVYINVSFLFFSISAYYRISETDCI